MLHMPFASCEHTGSRSGTYWMRLLNSGVYMPFQLIISWNLKIQQYSAIYPFWWETLIGNHLISNHLIGWLLQWTTNLPCTNIWCRLSKRPLEDSCHFERIRTNLRDVVEQRPQGGQRKRRREEENITKLQKHLQVIVHCTLNNNYTSVITALNPKINKHSEIKMHRKIPDVLPFSCYYMVLPSIPLSHCCIHKKKRFAKQPPTPQTVISITTVSKNHPNDHVYSSFMSHAFHSLHYTVFLKLRLHNTLFHIM